jgi:acetylornithine/succinyldiaminopimelate/putrescine aminotransferase
MMPIAGCMEFCTCGQEANMMAVWLSRAFAGRKKVLCFQESFHGWGEDVIRKDAAGVYADDVDEIPFDNVDSVEKGLTAPHYAIPMTEGGGAHTWVFDGRHARTVALGVEKPQKLPRRNRS